MSDYPNIGEYVKVPGYSPDESCPSVVFLELPELEKLKDRVAKAIEQAKKKQGVVALMKPGTRVVMKRMFNGIPPFEDHYGVVISRRAQEDAFTRPDDHVPVAFPDRGVVWVPVLYLEAA